MKKDLSKEEIEFLELIGEDYGINDARQIMVILFLLLGAIASLVVLIFLIINFT